MPQTEKTICPICHQARDREKCSTCRANSPRPAVWPPAPQPTAFISLEGDTSVNGWRDNFALGFALGFVCNFTLTLLIWTVGFYFGQNYISHRPYPVQHIIFYGMAFSPTLPAVALALIPATRGRKFSYGMLLVSGIGLLLSYLVHASLVGLFPFN